ncbi:MAG: Uma2 family endonuclease [Nitrospirae bacterium]|nr:Uma2 family endonuclease [Nitrospirota bacterium]
MALAEKYLPRYTVEDYKRWEGDWELIEGIPYAMAPSPYGVHQKALGKLNTQFGAQLQKCSKSISLYPELDWIIDENTVVRPDLMVVCKEVEEHLKEPPEVAIEVVSKNTAQKDEELKFQLYEREKVRFYILAYPDIKKVRVFELKSGRYDKVFDSDDGIFSFTICKDCTLELNIKEIFS